MLGSANMDLVVTVDRAPSSGETVTGRGFHTVPGGKGANQALAAARAGGAVRFLGAVGTDAYGEEIRSLLAAEGIDVYGLATTPRVPTGTAHITVDAFGANSIIVVPGANGSVIDLTSQHRDAIAASDILLLQLELPLATVTQASQFARSRGVHTILTPAPAVPLPTELLDAVDLLVPNEHEAVILTAMEDPQALVGETRDVLVTLGAQGVRYYAHGEPRLDVPAFKVDAVDTTAAGDTFVGAYAVAAREGNDRRAALRWASAAAALAVGRLGASSSMPRRTEIEQFLGRNPQC